MNECNIGDIAFGFRLHKNKNRIVSGKITKIIPCQNGIALILQGVGGGILGQKTFLSKQDAENELKRRNEQ